MDANVTSAFDTIFGSHKAISMEGLAFMGDVVVATASTIAAAGIAAAGIGVCVRAYRKELAFPAKIPVLASVRAGNAVLPTILFLSACGFVGISLVPDLASRTAPLRASLDGACKTVAGAIADGRIRAMPYDDELTLREQCDRALLISAINTPGATYVPARDYDTFD